MRDMIRNLDKTLFMFSGDTIADCSFNTLQKTMVQWSKRWWIPLLLQIFVIATATWWTHSLCANTKFQEEPPKLPSFHLVASCETATNVQNQARYSVWFAVSSWCWRYGFHWLVLKHGPIVKEALLDALSLHKRNSKVFDVVSGALCKNGNDFVFVSFSSHQVHDEH